METVHEFFLEMDSCNHFKTGMLSVCGVYYAF